MGKKVRLKERIKEKEIEIKSEIDGKRVREMKNYSKIERETERE